MKPLKVAESQTGIEASDPFDFANTFVQRGQIGGDRWRKALIKSKQKYKSRGFSGALAFLAHGKICYLLGHPMDAVC